MPTKNTMVAYHAKRDYIKEMLYLGTRKVTIADFSYSVYTLRF